MNDDPLKQYEMAPQPEFNVDVVLDTALKLVDEMVPEYHARELASAGLPFDYEKSGVEVILALRAEYNPETIFDETLSIVEGDRAAHDFTVIANIEQEIDSLPAEALVHALNIGIRLKPDDFREITCSYVLNIDFTVGQFSWSESRFYECLGETEDDNVEFEVEIGRGKIPEDEDQTMVEAGEPTEFSLIFGAFKQDTNQQQAQEKMALTMLFLESIKNRQSLPDLSFARAK